MFSPSLEEHHPALGRIPHDRPHCLHRRFCPGHLAGCCGIARKWTEALAGDSGPTSWSFPQGPRATPRKCSLRRAGQRVLAGRRRANRCRNRRRGTGNAPILHANGQPGLLLGDRGDARGGIDMETDFIVGPWLVGGALEGRSAAAGRHYLGGRSATHRRRPSIHSRIGVSLCGHLEPTGSSVDETIFMDECCANHCGRSPYLGASGLTSIPSMLSRALW